MGRPKRADAAGYCYHMLNHWHLYQGRYESFPAQADAHFLTLCRQVERNAFAAELCENPERWRWGSPSHWHRKSALEDKMLAPWPVRRWPNWPQWAATDFSGTERTQIDWSVHRGVPLGDASWVESVARKFDLESTMRPRGRPKKPQHT